MPQPDDREHRQGGDEEACMAVLNNFYGDGFYHFFTFIPDPPGFGKFNQRGSLMIFLPYLQFLHISCISYLSDHA